MNDLTPLQRATIVSNYQLMARTLAEFQLVRWTEFSYEQQLDLNAYQNSLLGRAHDLHTRTVNPAVDQGEQLTEAIEQLVQHVRARLQTAINLTLALGLGAMIVALASHVARANRKGIHSAISELQHLLELEKH